MQGAAHLVVLFLVVLVACGKGEETTGLSSLLAEDAPVIVDAAEPDTVTVDTTVVVRITGSGFTEGSTATWLMDTTAAAGIRTISTTYRSPTELEAIISVAPDAALRAYRIRIRTRKGKQGIGVERFRVVAKPIPLPGPGVSSEALDVNDSGVIVGWARDASGAGVAVKWTPADTGWTYTILGPGSAVAVNNDGLIVRTDFDRATRVWRSWIHLTSGSGTAIVPGMVHDINHEGTLVGVYFDATLKPIAATWNRNSATGWGTPQPLPLPAGYTSAEATSINAIGDVAGAISTSSSSTGVVWHFRDGRWQAPVPLDPGLPAGAVAINDAGELAGWVWPCIPGQPTCYASPAFWRSAGGQRTILPTLYDSRGVVNGMNNDGQAVGSALVHYDDGSGPLAAMVRHAVLWMPGGQWPEDLGAIHPSQAGEARAISNQRLVVGSINLSGLHRHAAAWILP